MYQPGCLRKKTYSFLEHLYEGTFPIISQSLATVKLHSGSVQPLNSDKVCQRPKLRLKTC